MLVFGREEGRDGPGGVGEEGFDIYVAIGVSFDRFATRR